ncbi:MAG: cytochrome c3 family protein [Calditrichia bacterium]
MKIEKFVIIFFSFFTAEFLSAQSVINSVHNLSVSGPGTIRAAEESEICIFCHTPHSSSPRQPLWNRPDPGISYNLYQSSTTQALSGQPTGASLQCLSCHDGTIALGNVLSRNRPIDFSGGITTLPSGTSNLTSDLSDDHPISFIYNSTLAISDGELADPASLAGPVMLSDSRMECTSCHDPHQNLFSDFLVVSNQYSDLCLYCHHKNYWEQTSHRLSLADWNGSGQNPWFHTPFETVSENGCENCHNPHNSRGHSRLMNYLAEESNCLACHDGNVAGRDIQAQFSKPYRHEIYHYNQIYDPEEPNTVQVRHVECEDCHNPHASRQAEAAPPNANGFVAGTRGIDSNGNPVDPVRYEYELCYRCHADSPDKPGSPTARQIEQNNVRLEFAMANPSYHPVEGEGKNPNSPSLISPLSETSIIYCTDCHASDGSSAPAGPHGSLYAHILKFRYETADNTIESYENYRLCYECHDRNTVTNGAGQFARRIHRLHIVGENTPCNACHDPHGINSAQGNSANNTHLINFDIAIVSADPGSGRLEFVDLGNFSGRCYLRCHDETHNPKSY